MDKLPKVFANKIDKEIRNNESVAYGIKKKEKFINVNQKINNIFYQSKYAYKVDVVIDLKDKKVEKRIIARNKNELICFDSEKIKISEIVDINIK